MIIKLFYFIFFSFPALNNVFAKNININEDLNLEFNCKLEKKIIKNSEYNYKTFLAEEVDEQNVNSLKLYTTQPSTLMVNGLSDFFSQNSNFDVKIVNKDVVLFKAFNKEKSYSELEFKSDLFLKAENKVPSSKLSISPPTGKPCASFVILTFVLLRLS